jgi:hypothetical protein
MLVGAEDVTKDVSHLTFEEVEEAPLPGAGLPDHACKVSEKVAWKNSYCSRCDGSEERRREDKKKEKKKGKKEKKKKKEKEKKKKKLNYVTPLTGGCKTRRVWCDATFRPVKSGFATRGETLRALTSSPIWCGPSTRKCSCTPTVRWERPFWSATTAAVATSFCWDLFRRKQRVWWCCCVVIPVRVREARRRLPGTSTRGCRW